MPWPPVIDLVVMGFNFLNVILAIVLIVIYAKTLRSIKSNFTWGLLLFALVLLLENISGLFWLGTLLRAGDYSLTMFQASVNVLEFIALAILVRLSLK